MESELNNEILDAISLNTYSDWDDNYGGPKSFYNKAADECEKIVYDEQIKLLKELRREFLIRGGLPQSSFTTFLFRNIDSKIKVFENKLSII